ncbi:MAG: zinc-dependent alcohol dehydrogenase [Actinomycetota bacterium]
MDAAVLGVGHGAECSLALVRAAVFEAFETVTLKDVPTPDPRPGEARIQVRYCGICGSDLSLFKTGILSGPDAILGHEISGVVETPAADWSTGDRVVPWPARGCGECVWCRRGEPRYCLEPLDHYGGFAEFVVFPAGNLVPIPGSVDDQRAALAEPLGVALRAVAIAEVASGDVVYVAGLGPIGLFTAVGCLDAGARVLGADPRPERRALAVDLGCEDAFDPTTEEPFWKLLAYDSLGPRVAFECSGSPSALQLTINVPRYGGVVGVLGIPFEPTPIIPAVLSVKELSLFSISGPSKESIAAALDLLARRPEVGRVATSVVPLAETGEAMSRLARGEAAHDVKVLVQVSSSPSGSNRSLEPSED